MRWRTSQNVTHIVRQPTGHEGAAVRMLNEDVQTLFSLVGDV